MDIVERLEDDRLYIDAIDDAVAEIQNLRSIAKKLEKKAVHSPGCAALLKEGGSFVRYPCDCGLEEIKRKVAVICSLYPRSRNMPIIDIQEALRGLEKVAQEKYDGHYTIMRFTTGYKVIFGTPELRRDAYQELLQEREFDNLVAAIVNAVMDQDT